MGDSTSLNVSFANFYFAKLFHNRKMTSLTMRAMSHGQTALLGQTHTLGGGLKKLLSRILANNSGN